MIIFQSCISQNYLGCGHLGHIPTLEPKDTACRECASIRRRRVGQDILGILRESPSPKNHGSSEKSCLLLPQLLLLKPLPPLLLLRIRRIPHLLVRLF